MTRPKRPTREVVDLVEVIAHRGAGQAFVQPEGPPENTLPAFEQGWREDVDACELDVHLTRDGQVIVIHDDTTNRTTNADWVVADRTLEELRGLDAGRWKGPQWAGIRLPTLEEVIDTIPDGKRLFLEIKTGPQILPGLKRVVSGSGKRPSQLPIISFDIDAIAAAKRELPEHECYLLVAFDADYPNGTWQVYYNEGPGFRAVTKPADPAGLDALVELARSAGLDGIDSSFNQPRGFSRRLQHEGMKQVVWTVDDPEVALEMVDLGIASLTTDVPAATRKALHHAGIPTGLKGLSGQAGEPVNPHGSAPRTR
jgi:glycerophosphoryl diester phosphodiesterase